MAAEEKSSPCILKKERKGKIFSEVSTI